MKAFESFDQLLEVVQKEKPKSCFSAIVSNPPYQDSDELAVYHKFIEVAEIVSTIYSFVTPARWMTGKGKGEGLREFAQKTHTSTTLSKAIVIFDSQDLFPPPVLIRGGVMISFWDSNKKSSEIDYSLDGKNMKITLAGIDNFLFYSPYKSILDQIAVVNSFSSRITYKANAGPEARNHKMIQNFKLDPNGVLVASLPAPGKPIAWARYDRKSPLKGDPTGWKVILSQYSGNEGANGIHCVGRRFIAPPDSLVAGSFQTISELKTKEECERCLSFFDTVFVNFLFGVTATTQDTTYKNWRYVPNVNFATGEMLDKPGTFLDFSKAETLDDQLAEIYELSEEDRAIMINDLKLR